MDLEEREHGDRRNGKRPMLYVWAADLDREHAYQELAEEVFENILGEARGGRTRDRSYLEEGLV